MAKNRTFRSTQAPSVEDRHVMIRVVLLSSILLGIVLTLSHILLAGMVDDARRWLNGLRTGVGLIIFWLFVTASVRSLHRLRPDIAFIYAVLTGVATAFFGILSFLLILRIVALIWDSGSANLPSYSILGFYSAAGLIAALFSMIHYRIKNKTLGTILEFVLVIGSALAVVYLLG